MTELEEEELLSLLEGIDPAKLKRIMAEMKPVRTHTPKDPMKKPGPIKQYVVVTRHYTCLSCSTKWDHVDKMEKGEEVMTISEQGAVTIHRVVKAEGSLDYQTHCTKCAYCEKVMKTWTREELEQKWLQLTRSCTFKEIRR